MSLLKAAADRRAEEIVYEELTKARPDYGFLGEEGGVREGADKTHRWIVDPLDGTKAFVRGDPHFTVNIGLIDHGQPVAGVVAAPPSGELWRTAPDGVLKRHGDGPYERVRPRGRDQQREQARPGPARVVRPAAQETAQAAARIGPVGRRAVVRGTLAGCREPGRHDGFRSVRSLQLVK